MKTKTTMKLVNFAIKAGKQGYQQVQFNFYESGEIQMFKHLTRCLTVSEKKGLLFDILYDVDKEMKNDTTTDRIGYFIDEKMKLSHLRRNNQNHRRRLH